MADQVLDQRDRFYGWMLVASAILFSRLRMVEQRIGVRGELVEEACSRSAVVTALWRGDPTILTVAVGVLVTRARLLGATHIALLTLALGKHCNHFGRAVEDQVGGVTAQG